MLIDMHYGVPGSYDLGGGPIKYVKSTDATNPQRQLYLCHNKCELGSTPLVDGLKPIAAFLKSHPREVMVFVNEDYIAPADFAAAATKAGLLKYIYKGSPTRFPTLAKMISSGQRVVITSESKTAPVKWYFEAYKSTLRETPYSFASAGLLTDPAGLAESCRANRGPANGPLFLMNHFVTRPPMGSATPKMRRSSTRRPQSLPAPTPARLRAAKCRRFWPSTMSNLAMWSARQRRSTASARRFSQRALRPARGRAGS